MGAKIPIKMYNALKEYGKFVVAYGLANSERVVYINFKISDKALKAIEKQFNVQIAQETSSIAYRYSNRLCIGLGQPIRGVDIARIDDDIPLKDVPEEVKKKCHESAQLVLALVLERFGCLRYRNIE